MLTRRLFMRKRPTQNVIAEAGDPDAGLTLVVLAHHDAAPSGVIFAQDVETWLADHHPEVIRRMTSNPPMWWLVIAGPALVAVGNFFVDATEVTVGQYGEFLAAKNGDMSGQVASCRRLPRTTVERRLEKLLKPRCDACDLCDSWDLAARRPQPERPAAPLIRPGGPPSTTFT